MGTFPFDAFDIERIRLRAGQIGTANAALMVQGTFRLPPSALLVDELDQYATVNFAHVGATIPGSAFRTNKRNNWFQFHDTLSTVGKTTLKIEIKQGGRFKVEVKGLDLSGLDLDEPMPWSLRIGDYIGAAHISFDQ